jgi:hypothetical protein
MGQSRMIQSLAPTRPVTHDSITGSHPTERITFARGAQPRLTHCRAELNGPSGARWPSKGGWSSAAHCICVHKTSSNRHGHRHRTTKTSHSGHGNQQMSNLLGKILQNKSSSMLTMSETQG